MEVIAVFGPLLGCLAAAFFAWKDDEEGHTPAQVLTCGLMVIAAICSVVLFVKTCFLNVPTHIVQLFPWIVSGDLNLSWALNIDQLSTTMMVVVNLVSCAVHIYSVGYMHHDARRALFQCYLSLFTFAMLMLVTSSNFVQLFFGWEGVGVASYLLIGFWHHKESANAAAIKAFVVNRIGDFGLALGIFAVFMVFGTLDFDKVFVAVPDMTGVTVEFLGYQLNAITLIGFLLFIGAMGKSAQLGLHTWLPDAMEGPTPVSALIHAATMVTAGVFLVSRMSPIYEHAPLAREFITVIGALTALVAATIAVTQFDIKRVIAYSTMSQLGYMFFAAGASAYGAAMFHLFTHAFFKALLFLGAGSVIHAMSDEQDMRRMGGIWRLIPWTYGLMWVGNLALAGVPPFAGFFSKDTILEASYASELPVGHFAYWCGIAAAFLTAFYSWRLLFMTFHGAPRADEKVMDHVHESPRIMLFPLIFLATGAVLAGIGFHRQFVGDLRHLFWGDSIKVLSENDSLDHMHHIPEWAGLLPTAVGLFGIVLAYLFYIKQRHLPAVMAGTFGIIHNFLYRKWYFDELYERIAVIPAFLLGKFLWKKGDNATIDGIGPDGLAATTQVFATKARGMQTGYVYHYAFAILIGVVVIITSYLIYIHRTGF